MCNHDFVRLPAPLGILLLFLGFAACAQPPAPSNCDPDTTPDCFSMGKRVFLSIPSERLESLTFRNANTLAPLQLPQDILIPEEIGQLRRPPSLAPFGVVLVELAPNASRDDVESFANGFDAPPGGQVVSGGQEEGSPVYGAGSADNVLINQIIVRFQAGTPEETIDNLLGDAIRISEPARQDRPRYVVEFPDLTPRETARISNEWDRQEFVQYSQPNFIVITGQRTGFQLNDVCPLDCPSPTGSTTGNDPLFAEQWYLNNEGTSGVQFADVNALKAWEIEPGNAEIVVAILDDGIETAHEDLVGKIHSTWNAFEKDADLRIENEDEHGTAVAGLAAAMTGNEYGIAGIGANVSIMAVRMTKEGSSPISVIQNAIEVAAETAHVLSMSFTLGELPAGYWPDLEDAIDTALDNDRVLVFAAGNDNGNVGYPASLSTNTTVAAGTMERAIISVSATENSDGFKFFSSADSCPWGSNFGNGQITVAAPGVSLVTTDRTGSGGYCSGEYANFSGTSASTPLVAGTAALLLSQDSSLSANEVKNRMQATATDLGADGYDDYFGHGRIDACRALLGENCDRTEGGAFELQDDEAVPSEGDDLPFTSRDWLNRWNIFLASIVVVALLILLLRLWLPRPLPWGPRDHR